MGIWDLEAPSEFTDVERREYNVWRSLGMSHARAIRAVCNETTRALFSRFKRTATPLAAGSHGAHGVGDDA